MYRAVVQGPREVFYGDEYRTLGAAASSLQWLLSQHLGLEGRIEQQVEGRWATVDPEFVRKATAR